MVVVPWSVLSWNSYTGEIDRLPEVKKNIDNMLSNYLHSLLGNLRNWYIFGGGLEFLFRVSRLKPR